MDSSLFNPILTELDLKESSVIDQARYIKFLKSFMIDTEKSDELDKEK